jgi:hypothetical protein
MQGQRIEIPASEIKLGDIYITHAAFASGRYREVIGLRPCIGPDEAQYVELTLGKDAKAPHGSEASVPVERRVVVYRPAVEQYSRQFLADMEG